jgi:hypothetical protein
VTTPDPFRFDDGAYVLGILDDADRVAFEKHLLECDECAERVATARAGADLLSGLTVRDVQETVPMPDTLLPGLLREAGRERRRRRGFTAALGGLVAAAAAAIVILVWPTTTNHSGFVAFERVNQTRVSATAKFVSHAWGTEIDLHCHYAMNRPEGYVPYNLVVIDRSGQVHHAGSWTLATGGDTEYSASTSVPRSDIKTVQITVDGSGTPILQLSL